MFIRIRGIEVGFERNRAADVFHPDGAGPVSAFAEEAAAWEVLPPKAGMPGIVKVPAAQAGCEPDEGSVRFSYRRVLAQCEADGMDRLALPVIGGRSSFPYAASAKIWTQEAIRHARIAQPRLRTIVLAEPDPARFPVVEKVAGGYIRHFLDVLCWGPMPTVDIIIEAPGGIVLIRRSNPPYGWALPGGFVDYGESLETAAAREAREETGLEVAGLRQFHAYSDPDRDARFHTVSTVFVGKASAAPHAADDAAEARVVPLAEIPSLRLAFDHGRMLADWMAVRGGKG